MSDWNDAVIAQFRAGDATIAERFQRGSLVLLHTVGAKSGQPRTNPVAGFEQDGRLFVVASYAGRPENPAWYHNLVADPKISIERWVGDELKTLDVVATVITGPERESLWAAITAERPGFADYQTKTDRELPVVELKAV